MAGRPYRAGESVEDLCRACKIDRMHTIIVVDGAGQPLRVECGYCGSQHNFRGPRLTAPASSTDVRAPRRTAAPTAAMPLVSERERSGPPMDDVRAGEGDLELLLRRIIREEAGVSAVVPAEKWRNGHLVLRPGQPGLQEKTWPIETFFHKVVMLRNRLRTLEQQVNASELTEDAKVKLQTYITGCYGTLTSFNVLFADEGDQFKGSSE